MRLSAHPANPLGILAANVLSPALVKKEDDITLMVRGLAGHTHTCVFACAECTRVGMCVLCAVRMQTCGVCAGACMHVACLCACMVGSGMYEYVHTYLCECGHMGECTRCTQDFSKCASTRHLLSFGS